MDAPALFDPETGVVELLLVPTYLERINGPWRWGTPSFEPTDLTRHFPFLPESEPTIVRLRPLMDHQELARQLPIERAGDLGSRTWWRWHAYAQTPFGWVQHPTPTFTDMKLTGLSLRPHAPDSREERLQTLVDYIESLLGPPDTVEGMSFLGFQVGDGKPSHYRWKRPWGRVTCFIEPRDLDAVLSIGWGEPRPLSWV